jgi:hypothetical protein
LSASNDSAALEANEFNRPGWLFPRVAYHTIGRQDPQNFLRACLRHIHAIGSTTLQGICGLAARNSGGVRVDNLAPGSRRRIMESVAEILGMPGAGDPRYDLLLGWLFMVQDSETPFSLEATAKNLVVRAYERAYADECQLLLRRIIEEGENHAGRPSQHITEPINAPVEPVERVVRNEQPPRYTAKYTGPPIEPDRPVRTNAARQLEALFGRPRDAEPPSETPEGTTGDDGDPHSGPASDADDSSATDTRVGPSEPGGDQPDDPTGGAGGAPTEPPGEPEEPEEPEEPTGPPEQPEAPSPPKVSTNGKPRKRRKRNKPRAE